MKRALFVLAATAILVSVAIGVRLAHAERRGQYGFFIQSYAHGTFTIIRGEEIWRAQCTNAAGEPDASLCGSLQQDVGSEVSDDFYPTMVLHKPLPKEWMFCMNGMCDYTNAVFASGSEGFTEIERLDIISQRKISLLDTISLP